MRDADVRAALRQTLACRFADDPNTRIVEEMGIWSGSVRIDVAVINGELHGYELKSARDTLERLPAQACLYNQVFDCVTLVVADCHVNAAMANVPRWWGLTVAVDDGDGVSLREKRRCKKNPSIDAGQLARLLWRDELLALLKRYGLERGARSRTVGLLIERLVDNLSIDEVRAAVREALKSRQGWLGQPVSNQGKVPIDVEPYPRCPAARAERTTGNLLDALVGPAADNSTKQRIRH